MTEGQTFTITFITNQSGSFAYTITGVTSADINGAALSGVVTNGQVLTYRSTVDQQSEEQETFQIALNNGGASTFVRINDPEPAQFVQGTFSGPTFISQTGQDQVNLAVTGPGPGVYNYSVTASPAVNFDAQSGNPPNGVFNWSATGLSNLRASLNLQTPHPATTLTATISRDGFQPYTAQLAVPAREPGERVFGAGVYEFVIPPYSTGLQILLIGAGGGGGTSQPARTGTAGGASSVSLGLTAGGGAAGFGTGDHGNNNRPSGGSAAGGNQQNTQGNIGQQTGPGTGNQAAGGLAGFTSAGSISTGSTVGQGGISGGTFKGGSWVYCTSGAGGGSVYSVYAAGALTPGSVISITVGSGGAGGGRSGGADAGRGQDGVCYIKWN